LLSEGLLRQDGSNALGAFVSEGRIQQNKLLDRAELFQQLFHSEIGPGGLGLTMNHYRRDP
jgi:hypothetical protein